MGVTEENIQYSLIQQFFSELPMNPETEVHLQFFLYHIYRDPEPWKRTAPYHRLLRLFIYSSITLSIHSSIIHPSIQLPHKYLLNVFPLMELIKNDDIYYGAIILEITRNKINGREGIQCSICMQI